MNEIFTNKPEEQRKTKEEEEPKKQNNSKTLKWNIYIYINKAHVASFILPIRWFNFEK